MLIEGERKRLLVKINKAGGDVLTQHWRTFYICKYRLDNCHFTASVFRLHAHNSRLMLINRKMGGIRFVVVNI